MKRYGLRGFIRQHHLGALESVMETPMEFLFEIPEKMAVALVFGGDGLL